MEKEWLLTGTLACTLFMTGVIWFVQRVQYPLFLQVPPAVFPAFHHGHTEATGRVVALPMLLELLGAALLLRHRWDTPLHNALNRTAFGLVVMLWLVTGLVSVPLHDHLAGGFDAHAINRLVHTNWLRTAAWTARSGLLLWLLLKR